MQQAGIVVDHCTKYEQNHPIILQDITTNTAFLDKIALITLIWHRAKCY